MTGFHAGAQVICPHPDPYLARRHGVVAGETVGIITRRSGVREDDRGWLVDWGAGGEVRCNPEELELVEAPRQEDLQQIVITVEGLRPALVPNAEGHDWGHFENRKGGSGTVTYVPRIGSMDLVLLAMRARDEGYTVSSSDIRCGEKSENEAKTYADIVQSLLRLGHRDAVLKLLASATITLDRVTVLRGGVASTFGRLGRSTGADDTAYREVFIPHWRWTHPEPAPKRPSLWRRLTGPDR